MTIYLNDSFKQTRKNTIVVRYKKRKMKHHCYKWIKCFLFGNRYPSSHSINISRLKDLLEKKKKNYWNLLFLFLSSCLARLPNDFTWKNSLSSSLDVITDHKDPLSSVFRWGIIRTEDVVVFEIHSSLVTTKHLSAWEITWAFDCSHQFLSNKICKNILNKKGFER